MRKYGITGLLFLAALCLQSCLFSEEDLFEDTSANRTAASVAKYTELLTGAENGWKLDYYPAGKSTTWAAPCCSCSSRARTSP